MKTFNPGIGPLQDPVTWYGINYAGTKITQWDFQNKEKPSWTGKSSFVLEVPQRYLRPSLIYSVRCDRILQRACLEFQTHGDFEIPKFISQKKNKTRQLKIYTAYSRTKPMCIYFLVLNSYNSFINCQ